MAGYQVPGEAATEASARSRFTSLPACQPAMVLLRLVSALTWKCAMRCSSRATVRQMPETQMLSPRMVPSASGPRSSSSSESSTPWLQACTAVQCSMMPVNMPGM